MPTREREWSLIRLLFFFLHKGLTMFCNCERVIVERRKQMKNKPNKRRNKLDKHLGCPSYPNCDEAPMGCIAQFGEDVERYGHRDEENINEE